MQMYVVLYYDGFSFYEHVEAPGFDSVHVEMPSNV